MNGLLHPDFIFSVRVYSGTWSCALWQIHGCWPSYFWFPGLLDRSKDNHYSPCQWLTQKWLILTNEPSGEVQSVSRDHFLPLRESPRRRWFLLHFLSLWSRANHSCLADLCNCCQWSETRRDGNKLGIRWQRRAAEASFTSRLAVMWANTFYYCLNQ